MKVNYQIDVYTSFLYSLSAERSFGTLKTAAVSCQQRAVTHFECVLTIFQILHFFTSACEMKSNSSSLDLCDVEKSFFSVIIRIFFAKKLVQPEWGMFLLCTYFKKNQYNISRQWSSSPFHSCTTSGYAFGSGDLSEKFGFRHTSRGRINLALNKPSSSSYLLA